MTILAWSLIALGFIVIAIASCWSWGKAAEESREASLWYLWQPYAIYYVITRWKRMNRPFLFGLIGVALVLLGAVIGWRDGGWAR